jgi:hypothetical protein
MFRLIAILLFAVPSLVSGKCVTSRYYLEGQVVTPDGHPLANAHVAASWKAWPAPGRVEAITDSQGRYRLRIEFDALSGESSSGDKCEGELQSTTIAVVLDGREVAKREVPMSYAKHEEHVAVPTIKASLRPNKSLERTRGG